MKRSLLIVTLTLLSFSAFSKATLTKELSQPTIGGAYCFKPGQTTVYVSSYDQQAGCLKSGGKLVK